MPVFCSNQPETSLKKLKEDPEFAFNCLQALATRLLIRRELSIEEAVEYFQDPREGDFKRGFKRPYSQSKDKQKPPSKGKATPGRPAKNSKTSKPQPSTSGTSATQRWSGEQESASMSIPQEHDKKGK